MAYTYGMAQKSTPSLLADHELVLLAEFARAEQRWPDLRGIGERLCEEYPENPKGPLFVALALREAGSLDVAEKLLEVALARFPDFDELAIEYAWLAMKREDWRAAERRWATVRSRDPYNLSGYLWPAYALRQEQRYAAAESLIGQAMVLFPDESQPALDYASIALEQRDYEGARRRYDYVHEAYPDEPMGFIGLGMVLTRLQLFEEADNTLGAALAAYPERVDVAVHYALVAQERRDWPQALSRFSDARQKFATDPQLALGVAVALIHLGEFGEAERELEASQQAFPNDVAIAIEHAAVPAIRGDWPESLRRWAALRQRFPDDPSVRDRADDAMMARRGEAILEAGTHPTEVPPPAATDSLSFAQLARHLSERPDDPQLQQELLARFESLGDNCEFGLVQRHFGAEPLSLFRWAGIPPRYLALALSSRLEGLGEPQNTEIGLYGGQEYFLKDKRRWFEMHTFIREGQIPYQRMFEQQVKRLRFLSRKLVEDLTQARKIFLYKYRDGTMTDKEIEGIHTAIRSYGEVTLLIVRLADGEHPDGSVQVRPDGLLLGYLERVSINAVRDEIAYDSWYRLCLNVLGAVCSSVRQVTLAAHRAN